MIIFKSSKISLLRIDKTKSKLYDEGSIQQCKNIKDFNKHLKLPNCLKYSVILPKKFQKNPERISQESK